jgi:hypothetical protein
MNEAEEAIKALDQHNEYLQKIAENTINLALNNPEGYVLYKRVDAETEEEPDYYTKLRNEFAKDLYVHKHVNMTSAIDSANAFVKKLKELK